MNEGLILTTVRRSNNFVLRLSAAALCIVVALIAYNYNFIYNFIAGPFEVNNTSLVSAPTLRQFQKYWINISGDELLDTGMQYVSTSKNNVETVEASYLALGLGNRLLLVRMPGNPASETLSPKLTGWLSEISSEENTEVIQKLEQDAPGIKEAFLPFKLETGDFRATGLVGILVGMALIILSIVGLVIFLRRNSDLESHPILKRLGRFGPLDFVVNRIEAELAAPHTTVATAIGKLHLTNTWLVYPSLTNVLATRFEDVAWVYKHVFKTRHYFFIVTKTISAMVWDRSGARIQIAAGSKEQRADEMLQAILQRAPWAVAGYSDDLLRAWNQDRPNFLAAVDQRKSQIAAQ